MLQVRCTLVHSQISNLLGYAAVGSGVQDFKSEGVGFENSECRV